MKLMSLTVPILIVSLTVIAVWGMGMLAVQTSAYSTQASLDLLRLHLRVARLHEELLQHSKQALVAHAAELAADGGPPSLRHLGESAAAAEPAEPETRPEAESDVLRPWPDDAAPARGALDEGLRKARPTLKRLTEQFDRTLSPH